MSSGQASDDGQSGNALWLPPLSGAAARRRPTLGTTRNLLSRDQIVSSAIGVADAEGADAVSMRRIARELGVGTMSLYWYVASKDELLALMIDTVEGEFEIPSPSGNWRADLTQAAHNIRAVLVGHGWMANFIGYRRSVGPNELVHLENSLATLAGADLGLDLATALRILMAIETYVLGFAQRDQQELRVEQDAAERLAANPESSVLHQVSDYIERLKATDRYPLLARLFEEGTVLGRDERFDYGLERLLDGIEADLHQHA